MNSDEKVIFLVGTGDSGDPPVVVLGIPQKAWEYMRDGKTHTFDLTKAGVPVKLLLFGCATHEAGLAEIQKLSAHMTVTDRRGEDFSL